MKLLLFLFTVVCSGKSLRTQPRRLAASNTLTNQICMQEAAGISLGCTANDVQLASATNIVVHDDGCQFAGDTVTFTAQFEVLLGAQARHDVGIWFAQDGDPNGDGALTGTCTVATTPYDQPTFLDLDGVSDDPNGIIQDTCGDIDASHNPQYPSITMTATCIPSGDGNLLLPYCTSWRQPGANGLCTSPLQASPGAPSKCKCDTTFTIAISVPFSTTVPPTASPTSAVVQKSYTIGDPHIETWSGKMYDFMGACDLVMLHSDGFARGLGIDIHVRTTEMHNVLSYVSSAVVRIGDDILEVHGDSSYDWNGVKYGALPSTFGGLPFTYEVEGGWLPMWEIHLPRAGSIFLQVFKYMVDLKISGTKQQFPNSVGLLGESAKGVLMARNGHEMTDTDLFAQEWQVRDDERMLFSEVREPQFPEACIMPDPLARLRLLENSKIDREDAEDACASAGELFEACVFDVLVMNDFDMAIPYLTMVHHGPT